MTRVSMLLALAVAAAALLAPRPPAGAHAVAAADPLRVPRGTTVQLDGRLDAAEWQAAASYVTSFGELLLQHDGEHLLVGVRAADPGFAHLCVARGDTVQVLHASAALGQASYARDDAGYVLRTGFGWAMRDTGQTDAVRAARLAHRREHGWVASTIRMGAAGEQELMVALPLLGAERQLAAAWLANPGAGARALGWPAGVDDCGLERLVSGYTPDRLRFTPSAWHTLVLDGTAAH